MKKTNNYISLYVILNIIDAPSISVRARPVIFARSIEYLQF
jgi:hypothetical protein